MHQNRATLGFTLVEILVVLVIIGLLAGVALPRLYIVAKRFEIASQRDNLLLELGSLGYRAYQNGRSLQLGPNVVTDPNNNIIAGHLQIPDGWQVDVPRPIGYSFNGICSGGQITVRAPDGTVETYTLDPPLCKPSLSRSVSGQP